MKKVIGIVCCIVIIIGIAFCFMPKTYVIATDDSFNPFCYLDGKGNPIGFDIDIINAIAEQQNMRIEILPVGLLDGMEAVQSGKADGMIAALIPSDDMMAKFDFSDMYYNNEYAFAVKKGSKGKLLKKFNESLSAIIESGKYDEIYQEHFGAIEE